MKVTEIRQEYAVHAVVEVIISVVFVKKPRTLVYLLFYKRVGNYFYITVLICLRKEAHCQVKTKEGLNLTPGLI